MMKPTSNAVLINGKQGAADQRRSWKGEGGRWQGREGEAVIDCTVCVLVVRRGGWAMCEKWRAGFALQAALKVLCPLRTRQLASNELPIGHAEYLIDTHTQPVTTTTSNTLFMPSPPPPSNKHNNASRAD